jgi:hypothetical protein
LVLVSAGCALAFARGAHAETKANNWEMRPVALEAHLGVATPTGNVGAVVDYAVNRWLSLGCGAGTDFEGLQVACMVRPRFAFHPNKAVYAGIGASTGPHAQSETSSLGVLAVVMAPFGANDHTDTEPRREEYFWDRAYWTNFEAGYEGRLQKGMTFRAYLGLRMMQNFADYEYVEDDRQNISQGDAGAPHAAMLYAGGAIGYAF